MRVIVSTHRSGRASVLVEQPDGSLKSIGTWTKAEAQARAAALRKARGDAPRTVPTIRNQSRQWIATRDKRDQDRWRLHVLEDPIADLPLRTMQPGDVWEFQDRLVVKRARRRFRGQAEAVELDRVVSSKVSREAIGLLRLYLDTLLRPPALLTSNPARAVKLAKLPKRKLLGFLYPTEDAALLACATLPIARRLFYGVLAREGMRRSEARGLEWTDLDLELGSIDLDENKSDDPRTWKLGAGVVRALTWWKAQSGVDGRIVFPRVNDHAGVFRDALRAAGVTRAALFERSASRLPIRVHDLRATFVTLSLMAGRSDTWVRDRTGHTTDAMLQRYRRTARLAAELDLGELTPLDEALPEIAVEGDLRPALQRGKHPFGSIAQPVELRAFNQRERASWAREAGDTERLSEARAGVPILLADPLRALRAAVLAGDGPRARELASEIAGAFPALLGAAARAHADAAVPGPHQLRAVVRLIDLLWPGLAPELDQAEGG